MAIILRFVNSKGILTERFLAIKGVAETSSETLYQVICDVLTQYDLSIQKMRGERYDGASNMSGQFNGLKALFLKDCPSAYFVHCFAHRLELALMTAAKACESIWDFFSILDNMINIVKSSPKRITELEALHKKHVDAMLESGELQSGRGANQMASLHRSATTRWGSHFKSTLSVIEMFDATYEVLGGIKDNKTLNNRARSQARGAWKNIPTFEFALNLHMMVDIMGITNILSQVFQQEFIDILAALGFLSRIKDMLQQLRDKGWETLIQKVTSFCLNHDIYVPDLNT
ncbi:Zinc finger MYM-type protein 1 [Linum grandiflorum]